LACPCASKALLAVINEAHQKHSRHRPYNNHHDLLVMFSNRSRFCTATLSAFVALFAGCSDGQPKPGMLPSSEKLAAKINQSKVDKPLALKDLTIGVNIAKVKGAKKISDQAYMFDLAYFGSTRSFLASTDKSGNIYEYTATLDGSFESLKSALEEKLTADNSKPIVFDCEATDFRPDSSAQIRNRLCRVSGQSDVLTIKEMSMQPTAKVAGMSQLPTVIVSIKLEGTVLAAESRSTDELARTERERAKNALRKKDI
jgi:hypothetical protein